MKNIPWSEIDPEIRNVVRILNNKGIITDMSCSGHDTLLNHTWPWFTVTLGSWCRNKNRLVKLIALSKGRLHIDYRYFGYGAIPHKPMNNQRNFLIHEQPRFELEGVLKYGKQQTRAQLIKYFERLLRKTL